MRRCNLTYIAETCSRISHSDDYQIEMNVIKSTVSNQESRMQARICLSDECSIRPTDLEARVGTDVGAWYLFRVSLLVVYDLGTWVLGYLVSALS